MSTLPFAVKNGGVSNPKISSASISMVLHIADNAKHIGLSLNGSWISFANSSNPKNVYATMAVNRGVHHPIVGAIAKGTSKT